MRKGHSPRTLRFLCDTLRLNFQDQPLLQIAPTFSYRTITPVAKILWAYRWQLKTLADR
jgi:hypothetical protein